MKTPYIFIISLILLSCTEGEQSKNIVHDGYWKGYDFRDTIIIHRDSTVELRFVEYLNHLFPLSEDSLCTELEKFIDISSASPAVSDYFMTLAEKYLYPYRTSSRIENMYTVYLNSYINNSNIPEEKKIRPSMHLTDMSKNTVGSTAADFTYTLPNGEKHKMHDIKSPLTLIYFNNPLCQECMSTLLSMQKSPYLKDMIEQGKLTVLSVYVDDEPEIWKSNISHYPKEWIVSMDEGRHIDTEKLYVLRIIPTMYLLDEDKTVILKNVTWKTADKYLQKHMEK